MESPVPRWVRMLLAVDTLFEFVAAAEAIVRDETILAWVPPSERDAIGRALYAREESYAPGGSYFAQGLFWWEERAIALPPFPTAGSVLVGGAGGGREVRALVERGFVVTAFDPVPSFAPALERSAGERGFAATGSFDDFVQAVDGREGPLVPLLDRAPFDAAILGWASLSHVLSHQARVGLLRAIRRTTRGPLMVSFAGQPEGLRAPRSRGRRVVRALHRALGAPNAVREGEYFYRRAGFLYSLTEGDLRGLASETGYDVYDFQRVPYGHALLVPRP